jgi:Cd2+/Zn2+-exporting ATPase
MSRPPLELPMVAPAPVAEESDLKLSADARRYRVDGMDCAACARSAQKAVAALPGVQVAEVSFGTASLRLVGSVDDGAVTAAVGRAGFAARPIGTFRAGAGRAFWRSDARATSTSASVALLVAAAVVHLAGASDAVTMLVYLSSMGVGGWPIARAALSALRHRSLDMNVLMALAAAGAVGIGAYAEGAWVLVLFAVGTTLETFALDRGRRSMERLMELAPARVGVLVDGREQTVGVEDVGVGTEFLVRPGERIALDGLILHGESTVDQAAITGESIPADKRPGDAVFAGTLNVHGGMTVRATRVAGQSTLSKVADLVEQAQASRAPSERFIDLFARIYTPLVFLAAVLMTVVGVLAGGELDTWFYRSLALLIVACPCSLVISVPVAVVSAVGGAARRGILVKGGQALEDLARVRAVAVDKTGTLTSGAPVLTQILVEDSRLDETEALAVMASVEARSEHPLAAALVAAAHSRGLRLQDPEAFVASPGRGVEATIAGRRLWAGGPRVLTDRTASVPAGLSVLEQGGKTVVALGEKDRVLALFGLEDTPRPEAAAAVVALRDVGVERITMLTGDAEPVARAIAGRTGIVDWRSGLLPEGKLQAVEEMQRRHGPVAMVGDGVNDAPALAAARIGVAMGAVGSDVALQSADVALMGDRLDRLAIAISLSRRTVGIMRFNVVASLLVKGVCVALAPFGLMTLVIAIAADMGMSLLVTLNALRLLQTSAGARAMD